MSGAGQQADDAADGGDEHDAFDEVGDHGCCSIVALSLIVLRPIWTTRPN